MIVPCFAYRAITRLNDLLNSVPERLIQARQSLEDTQRQLETAKEELKKPFPMEAELIAKSERLTALDSQLNMDNTPTAPEENTTENETDIEQENEWRKYVAITLNMKDMGSQMSRPQSKEP